MLGVNKVILVGNLGKDPEIKSLGNGRSRASFTLATNESYKNKEGERVTNTEWHNIVLWTPVAEIAERFLRKGSSVYMEGKLVNRSYEDKEGNTRYVSEVVVRDLVMLDSKSQNDTTRKEETTPEYQTNNSDNTGMDELPF